MSGFFPVSGGGGGANQNLNNAYERIGSPVQVAAASGSKGSYTALGTSLQNWRGFRVFFGNATTSTARYLLDIRVGGTTLICTDLYFEPNVSLGLQTVDLPMAVPAGLLEARLQSSVGSASAWIAVEGIVENAQSAPGYTVMEALNIDVGNTRPSTTDITVVDGASTTYTELVASAANTYGALLFSPGSSGTIPLTIQNLEMNFAVGAVSSEAAFGNHFTVNSNTAAPFVNRPMSRTFQKTIAAGSRLSAKIVGATSGVDKFRIAAYGFR